jgi:leucyl aminopeptidase
VPKLPFVTRPNAQTLPIFVVDRDGFASWLASQDRAMKRWVEANEFSPRGNRVLLAPDARSVLFGRGEGGLFAWSTLAQRLAPGRYRIEGSVDGTEAAIGWALAAYDFDRYRTRAAKEPLRELVWPESADRKEALRMIEAITSARDLINTPAADLGPSELASAARKLGRRYGARVKIVRGDALARGYPMVAAVGRGSARAPCLIDLSWGRGPKITLVGKGVCFDSGGLDLKNSQGMLRMKKDMAGAAIVLSLAGLIMDAKLPVRLRVLIPAVENLPGANAYRPLDVLRSRKGLTVEVSNTDAEGRLILADALADADRETPDLLIDVATLTGAARLALGSELTPFFASDTKLADELSKHGRDARDPVWRLPLHKAYRRHLDSRVADLKNAASLQLAGAITAALFLREFVTETERWLHLDVFGWNDNLKAGRPVGGEATGTRGVELDPGAVRGARQHASPYEARRRGTSAQTASKKGGGAT